MFPDSVFAQLACHIQRCQTCSIFNPNWRRHVSPFSISIAITSGIGEVFPIRSLPLLRLSSCPAIDPPANHFPSSIGRQIRRARTTLRIPPTLSSCEHDTHDTDTSTTLRIPIATPIPGCRCRRHSVSHSRDGKHLLCGATLLDLGEYLPVLLFSFSSNLTPSHQISPKLCTIIQEYVGPAKKEPPKGHFGGIIKHTINPSTNS